MSHTYYRTSVHQTDWTERQHSPSLSDRADGLTEMRQRSYFARTSSQLELKLHTADTVAAISDRWLRSRYSPPLR